MKDTAHKRGMENEDSGRRCGRDLQVRCLLLATEQREPTTQAKGDQSQIEPTTKQQREPDKQNLRPMPAFVSRRCALTLSLHINEKRSIADRTHPVQELGFVGRRCALTLSLHPNEKRSIADRTHQGRELAFVGRRCALTLSLHPNETRSIADRTH